MFNQHSKLITSHSPNIKISVPRIMIQKIFDEVAACEELRPHLETGGSFLGKIGANGNTWEIMQIVSLIPPGPEAIYERNYCGLDRKFQQEMITVFQKSDKTVSYCGDWHYHPYTIENPSAGDLAEDIRSINTSLHGNLQNAGFLYAIVSFHHRSRLFSWLSTPEDLVSKNERWKIKFFFLSKGKTSYLSFIPQFTDDVLFYAPCCNLEQELALLSIYYQQEFTITHQTNPDGFFTILLSKTIAQKQVVVKFILPPSFPYHKPEIFICTNNQRWYTVDQLVLLQHWNPDLHIVNLMHDICRQLFSENA